RKIKEAHKCEREVCLLYIAKPIIQNKYVKPNNENYYNASNNEYEEDNEITNKESVKTISENNSKIIFQDNEAKIESEEEEQQWDQFINNWIELKNSENQFEDDEDYIFSSPEWSYDFSLAGRTIHLSDDENSKWSLDTLCIPDIEPPLFLDDDHIFMNAK
ncbi:12513_t:CDS:2, partial [Cetraspora pellucida]